MKLAFLVFLASLGLLATARAEASGPVPVISALGDSLTAGYGLPPGKAYPEILATMLAEAGHPVKMVNAGVSGDTSAGGLARLDWVLGDDPDIVILALGANDGLRGLSVKAMRHNLDTILAKLDQRGILVLLAGMYAPPNLGRAYTSAFDGVFPELAKEHDVAAFYPFLLKDVATNPALNQGDGIHPNEAGARIIAENLFPVILPLVRRAEQAARTK